MLTKDYSVRPFVAKACWFALVGLLAAGTVLSVLLPNLNGDFPVYFAAAERVRSGLSPYALFPAIHPLAAYQYAPWGAWLLVPLTYLPLASAQMAFGLVNLALLAGLTRWCAALFWPPVSPRLLILAGGFGGLLCWELLSLGQYTLVVAAAFAAMLYALRSRRYTLAGLLFPVLLIKPQLVLLLAPAFIWRAPARMRWVALASVAALLALAFALARSWPVDLVANVLYVQARDTLQAHNGSLHPVNLSALVGLVLPWSYVVTTASLAVACWLAYRLRHLDLSTWLALVAVLSLVAGPSAHRYDLALSLPLLYWLMGSRLSSRKSQMS